MQTYIETTIKISTITKDIRNGTEPLVRFYEKRAELMEGCKPDCSQAEIIATVKM